MTSLYETEKLAWMRDYWRRALTEAGGVAQPPDQLEPVKYVKASHALQLSARIVDLEAALTMMYDKWENGDGCYEGADLDGDFLGNAFQLSQEEEENQVLALIGSPASGGVKS